MRDMMNIRITLESDSDERDCLDQALETIRIWLDNAGMEFVRFGQCFPGKAGVEFIPEGKDSIALLLDLKTKLEDSEVSISLDFQHKNT